MHIPDGFLDTKTAISTGVLSATGLGMALRHVGRHVQPRQIPLIGLTAAFIFVAQMINFPVAGGTSGHLLGATLAAVLLGPSAAVIVMSCVLIIQALIFADGGLLAMGANVLNMGVVAPVCAYIVYRTARRLLGDRRGQLISASFAAWCSAVAASVFCAGELAFSGTVEWSLALPAMAGVHSLIGIGEAAITMLVLAAIGRTRPELLDESGERKITFERMPILVYGSILILGMLVLIVPFASTLPDGLQRVAQFLGFEYRSQMPQVINTPLKAYGFPGVESLAKASVLAGLVGAVSVFGLSFLVARILVPRKNAGPMPTSHPS
ncbi:MAG TPA: energy-coupling factor ABC transporter permease [Bacteroidota bacterium]